MLKETVKLTATWNHDLLLSLLRSIPHVLAMNICSIIFHVNTPLKFCNTIINSLETDNTGSTGI